MVNSYPINLSFIGLVQAKEQIETVESHSAYKLKTNFKSKLKAKAIYYCTPWQRVQEMFGFGQTGYFNLIRTIDQIAVNALEAYRFYGHLKKINGPIELQKFEVDVIQAVTFIHDWRMQQIERLKKQYYKSWFVFFKFIDHLLNRPTNKRLQADLTEWRMTVARYPGLYLHRREFLIATKDNYTLYLEYTQLGQVLRVKKDEKMVDEIEFQLSTEKTLEIFPTATQSGDKRMREHDDFLKALLKQIMSTNNVRNVFYCLGNTKTPCSLEVQSPKLQHFAVRNYNDEGIKYAMMMESVTPEFEKKYLPIEKIISAVRNP